jgi:uncharacterized membrane protein
MWLLTRQLISDAGLAPGFLTGLVVTVPLVHHRRDARLDVPLRRRSGAPAGDVSGSAEVPGLGVLLTVSVILLVGVSRPT